MRDPYAVLGISRMASEEEVKAAYRRLALQYHPDRNPGNRQAEERFKDVAAAYQELTKPQQRRSPPPPPREPPPPRPPCCVREVTAKCSCGHLWGQHMGTHPHACVLLNCPCPAFREPCCARDMATVCACGHPWGRHRRDHWDHPHRCVECACAEFSNALRARIYVDGIHVWDGPIPFVVSVVTDGGERHEIHPRTPAPKTPWWELEVCRGGVKLGNTVEFREVLRDLKGGWTPAGGCEYEEAKRKIKADQVDWEFFPEKRSQDKGWRPPAKMRARMQ